MDLKYLGQTIKAAASARSSFAITAVVILAITTIAVISLLVHLPAIFIFSIVLVSLVLIFVVYLLHHRHVSKWPPGLSEAVLKSAVSQGYTISGTSQNLISPNESQSLRASNLLALPDVPNKTDRENTNREDTPK
jgi:hypothetical protein